MAMGRMMLAGSEPVSEDCCQSNVLSVVVFPQQDLLTSPTSFWKKDLPWSSQ